MPCKKYTSCATPCWIETAYPWASDTDSFCENIGALDSENGRTALVGEFDVLVKSSQELRTSEGSVARAAAWWRVRDDSEPDKTLVLVHVILIVVTRSVKEG